MDELQNVAEDMSYSRLSVWCCLDSVPEKNFSWSENERMELQ